MRRLRKRSGAKSVIRRRALRIEQNDKHPLYVFCLTGDEILEVADISRLSRDDAGKLIGYQRADVKRHIQDIVEYLNSDDILFPNSLILALSSKVKFHVSRGPVAVRGLRAYIVFSSTCHLGPGIARLQMAPMTSPVPFSAAIWPV